MVSRIPKTYFSTPLSGSAREAEARIRNIFRGQKKRPPVWLMVLVVLCALLCGSLVSCQEGAPYAAQELRGYRTEEGYALQDGSGQTVVLLSPEDALSQFPAVRPGELDDDSTALPVYYGENGSLRWAVVCSGPSAGSMSANVLLSQDGGQTFALVSHWFGAPISGAGFLSADCGFLCLRYTDTLGPAISWTRDGGQSWEALDVPRPEEFAGDPMIPLSPTVTTECIAFPVELYHGQGPAATVYCGYALASGEWTWSGQPDLSPTDLRALIQALTQPEPVPSAAEAGETLLQAASPEGGEFFLRGEEPPAEMEAQSDLVAALYYRAPGAAEGEEQYLAALEYGPDHHYWDTVALRPFTGVLGYDGVVFSHQAGTAWYARDYYAVTGQGAVLAAPCYNKVYQADLDNDGQPELISNYHTMGYMDLYQRQDNGLVLCWSLNEAARELLSLPEGTWVALSGGEPNGNGDSSITARWQDASGAWQEHTFGETWGLPMAAGASQGHASCREGGTERTFLWSPSDDPCTMAAYCYHSDGTWQELLSLDLSRSPCVRLGGDPLQGQYALGIEAFSGVLGRDGVIFSYYAGGRQVQHFFYLDGSGQAAPLALCDPGWQTGDLDGDGLDELWSLSQGGGHFYLYRTDPAGGPPQCAFLCGADGSAPQPFRDFDRAEQWADGSFSFFDSSNQPLFTLSGPEFMALADEYNAWSSQIPNWWDGGRITELGG